MTRLLKASWPSRGRDDGIVSADEEGRRHFFPSRAFLSTHEAYSLRLTHRSQDRLESLNRITTLFCLLSVVLSACGPSSPSLAISNTCQQYREQQASSGLDPSDELKDLVKNLFKEEEHGGEDARLISGKRSSAADGPCAPAPNLPAAIYSPPKELSSFPYPYDQVVSNCSAALVKYLIRFPVIVTVGTWGNNNQFQPQGTYIEPDAVSGNYLPLPEQGGQLSGSSEQESIAEAVYSEYSLSTHYYPHYNSGIFELDLPANSSVQ